MKQKRRLPVTPVFEPAAAGAVDPGAARRPRGRVTRIAPEIEHVWRLRKAARVARERGELEAALELYRQLVGRLADDGDALHWLGVLEHRLGRPAAGRACLARAVALGPRSARRRFHLAEMLRACDAYADALEHYGAAADLSPEDPAIRHRLGLTLLALDRVDEAVQTLGRAHLLAPADAGIRADLDAACAAAACGAGEVLGRRRRWAEAAACYRRALELTPGHERAMSGLESCLARLEGKPETAGA